LGGLAWDDAEIDGLIAGGVVTSGGPKPH